MRAKIVRPHTIDSRGLTIFARMSQKGENLADMRKSGVPEGFVMKKTRALFTAALLTTLFAGCTLFANIPQMAKKRIESYMQNNDVPGISAVLVVGNNSYLLHFGYANPKKYQKVTDRSLFELGSIGKCFVATVLAHEVLHSGMHLNDTLDTFFPYLQKNPSNLCGVSLQQLVTHTSGLPRTSTLASESITEKKLLESLQDWQPKYPLGTHFLYSNLGFHILRFALENHAQTEYSKLLSSIIIAPLAMNSTTHCVPTSLFSFMAQGFNKSGRPVSGTNSCNIEATGALFSTSSDMLQFLQANLGRAGPDALIHAMQLSHEGVFKVGKSMTQALAWQRRRLNGFLVIDKNGATNGFSTWMGMIPELNIGLVLLTNRRCSELTPFAKKLLADISKEFVAN